MFILGPVPDLKNWAKRLTRGQLTAILIIAIVGTIERVDTLTGGNTGERSEGPMGREIEFRENHQDDSTHRWGKLWWGSPEKSKGDSKLEQSGQLESRRPDLKASATEKRRKLRQRGQKGVEKSELESQGLMVAWGPSIFSS